MHVKYKLLLAMVSLAVAVRATVRRMALFRACQQPMARLSLQAPWSPSARGRSGHFGLIAALRGWHSVSLSFQHISGGLMSECGPLQHPWECMLFSLKSGYVDCSPGSGASRLQLPPKEKKNPNNLKKKGKHGCHNSASLLSISCVERCSAGPCEIVGDFCLKSHCGRVMRSWLVYQAI